MIYEWMVRQEERRAREHSTAENSARRAKSVHFMRSTGVGQVRVTEPIRFQVRFLQEPGFTTGAGIITQPDPANYQDPIGTAVVRSWLRNIDGEYLGAYVALRAELWTPLGLIQTQALPVGSTQVSMAHTLIFEGLAYKHLGDGVIAAADVIEPRTVGFGGVE